MDFDGGNLDGILDGGSFSGSQPTYETPTAGFKDFSFVLDATNTPRAGDIASSGLATFRDRLYNHQHSNIIKDDKLFTLTVNDNIRPEDITISFEDTGVATTRAWGLVTHLINGTGKLFATSDSYSTSKTLSFVATSGFFDTFLSYAPGSFSYSHENYLRGLLNVADPAINIGLYSAYNPATTGYVRNSNFLLNGVDVSFLASWNSVRNAPDWQGIAITPRHVLFPTHVGIYFVSGSLLHFTSMDNNTYVRTVEDYQNLTILYPDLLVARLDQDLPADIKPIKIWSSGKANYLPSTIGDIELFPDFSGNSVAFNTSFPLCCWINKRRNLYVRYLNSAASPCPDLMESRVTYSQYDPNSEFFAETESEDSGTPIFLILNGEPVLLFMVHYMGGGGVNLSCYTSEITGMIHTLSPSSSYPLSLVGPSDLTSFTFY